MADIFPRYKVGFVNFINTSQIYIPWKESGGEPDWDVIEGTPAFLNRLLDADEIDVGIVSSYFYGINYQKYIIFPDLSISATGAVGSVILFSKTPVKKLDKRIVITTQQSATSVNLLKIVLEDFFGVRPIYLAGDLNIFNRSDSEALAYLAIGDEALRLRETIDLDQIDLAEVWLEHTGLPFVFAVWAIRKKCLKEARDAVTRLNKKLNSCRLQGQKEIERISGLVAPRIPMDQAKCLDYLKGIELDLSEKKREGLLYFFDLLKRRGCFPTIASLNMFF